LSKGSPANLILFADTAQRKNDLRARTQRQSCVAVRIPQSGGWVPGFPEALDAGAARRFGTAITNAGRPYDLSIDPEETSFARDCFVRIRSASDIGGDAMNAAQCASA
jgi:hypothetical protein